MVYGFINHSESNENKFHCSVLFDLQQYQYPFQHGQPAVIQICQERSQTELHLSTFAGTQTSNYLFHNLSLPEVSRVIQI